MPSRRSLTLAVALLAGGALLGYLAAGGAAGPSPARPKPGANPARVTSRPATGSEVAAAGLAPATLSARSRQQTVKTRISSHAVRTDPESGDFIGLTCPRGYTALSGGAVTGFTDLLISHSAPLKPTGGHRYTPRTWWVAVTNIPVDGSHGNRLPWYPVVNCVNRLRVGK
jgi:hypothetical protein